MRAEISKLRSFEVAGWAVQESESLSGQGAKVAKLQSFEVAGRAVKKILGPKFRSCEVSKLRGGLSKNLRA